ncbi:MAG TPA: hypothetical protein VIK72_18345 [Clostridiaceae bacterium]
MNFERKRILIYAVTFLIWAIAFTFLALAIDLKAIIREYSISWGTLTLINSEIAQGKNKSGVTWFLLSIFLGPIATFLLVISSKDTDTTGSRNTI